MHGLRTTSLNVWCWPHYSHKYLDQVGGFQLGMIVSPDSWGTSGNVWTILTVTPGIAHYFLSNICFYSQVDCSAGSCWSVVPSVVEPVILASTVVLSEIYFPALPTPSETETLEWVPESCVFTSPLSDSGQWLLFHVLWHFALWHYCSKSSCFCMFWLLVSMPY